MTGNADIRARYESNIFERIKGSSIEKVAQEEGLSFDEIQGIFKQVSSQCLKKKWEPVLRLSIDEIAMRKGHKNFKTVVSDIDRGKLIEVIDGHTQKVIIEKLMAQPFEVTNLATKNEGSLNTAQLTVGAPQSNQEGCPHFSSFTSVRDAVKEVSIDMWGGASQSHCPSFPQCPGGNRPLSCDETFN